MSTPPLPLPRGEGPYTLPEVAHLTGLSLRSIELGCRRGRIDHVPIGEGKERQHRRMYGFQVRALVEARARSVVSAAPTPAPEPVDDLTAAREATRKRLSRGTGHRRIA